MDILIVEDDVFFRETLARMVQGWGHAPTVAETGRAALEKAAGRDFDLFLLDVFLPDTTAMDLIPRIQAFRPQARIVTLTGQSTRELELGLRELGIAYYMAKPVQAPELKSIIDHLCRREGLRNTGSPPT
ncbi:MAG TPA: response regulator, partial [Desulfosarcina sp.]|nr:response regulator [Desulfosarcina sp.]